MKKTCYLLLMLSGLLVATPCLAGQAVAVAANHSERQIGLERAVRDLAGQGRRTLGRKEDRHQQFRAGAQE